jgi:hypothetical protein
MMLHSRCRPLNADITIALKNDYFRGKADIPQAKPNVRL